MVDDQLKERVHQQDAVRQDAAAVQEHGLQEHITGSGLKQKPPLNTYVGERG